MTTQTFRWKSYKDKFKGEGIYFLTFVVKNRVPLLGQLKPMADPEKIQVDGLKHVAVIDQSLLGQIVMNELLKLQDRHPGLQIIAKQTMPDHLHCVVWCHREFDGSIKAVAHGFSQACSREARRLVKEGRLPRSQAFTSVVAQSDCADSNGNSATLANNESPATLANKGKTTTPANSACNDEQERFVLYDCGNGATTLLDPPFIRTLSHRGQLRSMIDYTHANPDNAWVRHLHPDLYVIHRHIQVEGLLFDQMGKSRLLAYPDTQVIALSRSLTASMIDDMVKRALLSAECGIVTYCGVMNDGEKAVTMAVRHAAHPLVVMLLDGFPPAGSEQARFYHPGGVYHRACGEGRLLLLAPDPANYLDPRVIALTEEELRHKAELKHQTYVPIPHTSKRWRMIANNVMLKMIAGKG